jgi:hypothetical protein
MKTEVLADAEAIAGRAAALIAEEARAAVAGHKRFVMAIGGSHAEIHRFAKLPIAFPGIAQGYPPCTRHPILIAETGADAIHPTPAEGNHP